MQNSFTAGVKKVIVYFKWASILNSPRLSIFAFRFWTCDKKNCTANVFAASSEALVSSSVEIITTTWTRSSQIRDASAVQ